MSSILFQHDFTLRRRTKTYVRLRIMDYLHRMVRICLMIGVSLCACVVFAQAVADRYSRQQTQQGIRRAISLDPRNPEHYAQLARFLERPLKQGDLSIVIGLYEKAIQLSRHNAYYWARLAQAYEWDGRLQDAQDSYQQAKSLSPASPTMSWTIGNFYLREGKTNQALELFQQAILGDPELRRPAFDLAWRATQDGDLIAREMIPARPDIYFDYLDYLVGTDRLDEAVKAWDRVSRPSFYFNPMKAFPYLDALIQHRWIDQLTDAWTDLKKMNPSLTRESEQDANLITNGDFEAEILNGGLDWRINSTPGDVISIDKSIFRDGGHSLRIQFDGKQNLSEALIFQYVPVRPNTSYQFMAYMRSQGITTDNGPRFQIRDADNPVGLSFQSSDLVGNSPWVRRQLDFKSGAGTRLLEIRITRPLSRKLDNKSAGTIWVDQLKLTPIESAASTDSERNAYTKRN